MKPAGLLLIILSFLPPIWLFPAYSGNYDIGILFSHYAGAVSLIAMAWVQLMATRLPGTEALFGPLDRIYVLHKWLAIAAIVAAFLHDSIEADPLGDQDGSGTPEGGESGDGARPNMPRIGILGTVQGFAGDLGDLGYKGILILGVGSLMSFIPYHIWRWTHRFIGLFFALAAVHFLLIRKVFATEEPLGLYIALFCLIGIGSFLYLSLKGMLNRRQNYRVAALSQKGGVTSITLKPEVAGKTLRHRPGQFAFLSFAQEGFSEAHPFTIASAPRTDGSVRFCIANLGDYTRNIHRIAVGTRAKISHGYGRFLPFAAARDQIWVAGGVGITPFLAWLQDATPEATGKITLYYGIRSMETSPFLQELEAHAARLPNLRVKIFAADTGRKVSAQTLLDDHGSALQAMPVAFCGPAPMRAALQHGLRDLSVTTGPFHYEEFQMRSGLGLRALWRRLTASLQAKRTATAVR